MYTILVFYALWDKHCDHMLQELKEHPITLPDVKFMLVDYEEAIDMTDNYHISFVPTFVVKADNGACLGIKRGFTDIADLETFIKQSINGKQMHTTH